MKKLQRFLCAMLCIVMCIAMVLPAAASSNSDGTVSSEKTQIKDPITAVKGGYTRIAFTDANNSVFRQTGADGNHTIVSKSDANLANSKYPYALASMHASAGNIGKDYPSFVVYNGVDCIKPIAALDISYGGKYGFAFNVNTKHQDYKKTNRNYAVITYATEAEDTIELRLTWGNPDMTNRQIGGTYTTETGKWQAVSFPLSGAWKDGREKLGIYSNDEFYIRELVFFESKDDAEKYALRAGAYFNGEDYSEIKAMYNDPINSVTAKSIRYTFTDDNITDSGFATIRDHGNGLETKENPQNVFTFNDGRVSYVNAKGVPRGAPSKSGKNKYGMSVVFNGLGKSLTKSDDVYVVATYQSDSDKDHVIGFYPITYDKCVDIARVAKNTKGWCASEPFSMRSQASIASGTYKGQTMFERIAAREVILYTSAEDVDGLNLREIVFIADKAQAEAYSKAATEYYNAIEKNLDPIALLDKNKQDNWETIKLIMMLVGSSIAERVALKPNVVFPFENIDDDAYSAISFNSDNEGSKFDYVQMKISEPQDPLPITTKYNDKECVKMAPWYKKGGLGATFNGKSTQHLGLRIKKSAFEEDDLRYFVVQYASVSEVDHSLYLWNPSEVIKIADVEAGRTDWCITDVLTVSEALYNRINSVNSIALSSYSKSALTEVYVSSIIFFENKSYAERYIKQYNEYYKDKLNPVADPINASSGGYTRITFAEANNRWVREDTGDGNYTLVNKPDSDISNQKYPYYVNSMHSGATTTAKDYPSFVVYNGLDCIKPAKALVSGYGGDYGVPFAVNTNHENYKLANRNYAVITYATDVEHVIEFGLTWGVSTTENAQISGKDPHEIGKWQSISFELPEYWKTNRDRLGIYSDDEFYIREIVFFETKADADAYAAKAGAYFND